MLFFHEHGGEKCDLWPGAPGDPDEITAITSSAIQFIIIYFVGTIRANMNKHPASICKIC